MSNRHATSESAPTGRARIEPPDLSERGGPKGGQPQRSDDRLFMQLLAFGDCRDAQDVAQHLARSTVPRWSTRTSTIRRGSRS